MNLKSDLSFSCYLSAFCWFHLWFFCFFLLLKKRQGFANQLLALFLFCFAFVHIQHILLQTGLLAEIPFFDPICGIVLSAIGPLFYFYVRTLTGVSFCKRDWWHALVLIPGIVHFFLLLFTKNVNQLAAYYYQQAHTTTTYTAVNIWLLSGMLLYLTAYLLASALTIKKYLSRVKAPYSKTEQVRLKWLKELIFLLIIFSLIVSPIALYFGEAKLSSLMLGYFSTLIYFVIVYKSLNTSILFMPELVHSKPAAVNDKPRYTGSLQTEESIEAQGKVIAKFISTSDLVYQESVSLKQMGDALNIPPYLLSEIINRHFNKNFFELINSARVEKAKNELLRMENLNITIEGVGYNCGFGSKAAFYRAFKKCTGYTPTAYLKTKGVDFSMSSGF